MKKLVLFLSVCALLASAVWVGAAGDAGDPLASLSYLNGEFSQRAEKKIDQALEQSDKELAERLKNGEVGEATATWQETRLKEGDTLHGVTGTGVLLLAGRGRVTYESGAVVDVTTGAVVPSGTNLTANHRYLTPRTPPPPIPSPPKPRWWTIRGSTPSPIPTGRTTTPWPPP